MDWKATDVEGEEEASGFDSERVTKAQNGLNRRRRFRPQGRRSKDDVVIDLVVDVIDEEEEKEMKEMAAPPLMLLLLHLNRGSMKADDEDDKMCIAFCISS